jgi:3-methyladenine DNA glycosylase AlkD
VLDLDDLAAVLRAGASPDKKAWWERYLKGAIHFYGVPMADIRRAIHGWAGDAPAAAQREAAFDLLTRSVAEEKLAGILIMQELLLPAGEFDSERDLARLARVFDRGHLWEWNTTDWLCVRVLGPSIEAGGRPTAARIAAWVDAPGLWRRRAGAVAFVPVASRGDELFEGLVDMVLEICRVLVADHERFAQTGVGWVLRDLSDATPDRVYDFVSSHRDEMSREAVRMAAARLSDAQRVDLGITGRRRRR